MREGSLEAPVRQPLEWQNPWFWDEAALEKELERVFDICHGCRRCFNLCDSFPRLFDMIDNGPTGELDGVDKAEYAKVEQACTLCDMCFMTKCPYVPPHPWALDFPHLMLRHRAVQARKKGIDFVDAQLADTDRAGRLGTFVAGLMNWATDENNQPTRRAMERFAGIHHGARLPKQAAETFEQRARRETVEINEAAPAFGKRKAVLYATCFVNFHSTEIGAAARAVLAKNGVPTEALHPACCGMPKLELGDLEAVAAAARKVSAELLPWVEKGYDIVALTPSCALMLKFEWPLLLAGDPAIERLAQATFDLSEYVVDIAKKHGLAEGLEPVEGGISMHLACHARAQNMGPKGAEMLRLIPKTRVAVIERCSGHGGIWGARTENFDVAVKVGKPAAQAALKNNTSHVASECPLAGEHLMQVMEMTAGEEKPKAFRAEHPIEILARAYGLRESSS
ncbi:glycerol-3-phosphate dehydrogenase subunit C [Enhydrobacter aerosaccus]|uniref:Glycerol-3-phosphate dehydrogenase subunit C n=1 Tax=Enhydrobacter aerosaccus TaxID=225324 RepID=A0A1T4TL45_9HYPH|nr:heterodisulfide reductase-related iron-sulfur binding cluster [Enhydrobacter aerosaccus]SKA41011.1 glycerol-3-phosphate dehydrogenase subunit C [Enhydrobacter aerosaccus]